MKNKPFISRTVDSQTFHLIETPFNFKYIQEFSEYDYQYQALKKIQKSTNNSVRVFNVILILLIITVCLPAH